jgi:hypothetical protein
MFGTIIETIKNTIDPDRPARLTRDMILKNYGDPGHEYESKYMTTWDVGAAHPWFEEQTKASKIYCNKEFSVQLDRAFHDLQVVGVHTEIKTFDGCYNIRNTRGTGLISLHSWGMATDLNASLEKLGQITTHWSDKFIEVMREHVYWGGDYKGRKDPMHFSLFGE